MPIKCENISVSLGGNEIVKSLSLDIDNNSFIGIIGPNGSGKSTLLKTIYRVLKANEGVVYLNNTPLNSIKYRDSAKAMAVVNQHNYYNFDFKVDEVVLMGRSPHKKALERDTAEDYNIVNDCLKKVEMLEFKNRIFSTLSGGEQQRIMLARALAQKTSILILDEPTNHLDIKHQIKIMGLCKKLEITVLVALHDLNIASAYCDRLYVMKSGEIFAEGTPKDVLTKSIIRDVYEIEVNIFKEESTDRIHVAFVAE